MNLHDLISNTEIASNNQEGEKMFKVMIVSSFGQSVIHQMPIIPRIGDTIPLFYNPRPKVLSVVLLPELFSDEFKDFGLDALVTAG